MNLFLDRPEQKTKVAAATITLSENTERWESEILNALHRQAPFAAKFDMLLDIKEQDEEKRYLLGSVRLQNKTAINPRDTKEKIQGIKAVLIPVIVKDGKLESFETFLAGKKAWPLTRERLQRAMFRPQMFEASRKNMPGSNFVEDLLSTSRASYNGGYQPKLASVQGSLLEKIATTINASDLERFRQELESQPRVRAALLANDSGRGYVEKLANVHPVSGEELEKLATAAVPATVLQVSKVPGGFKIKTANPAALAPKIETVDRPTAVTAVGHDIVRKVENDGTVTLSTDAPEKKTLSDVKIETIKDFGQYNVKTKDGRQVQGWVFPSTVDLDGVQHGLAVFSNGSESAIQEQIAGSFVGKGTNIIDVPPSGDGVFYLARQGSAVALLPMNVVNKVKRGEEIVYKVKTLLGESATLRLTPGLKGVMKLSKGEYAIPDDMGFLPLPKKTALFASAEGFTKLAAAQDRPRQAELFFDGQTFNLRGPGVVKLGKVLRTELTDVDDALFSLAVLGTPPEEGREKIAVARTRKAVPVLCREITLEMERMERCKQAASPLVFAKAPLAKIAALIDDPQSVDNVLSLNFLNDENVQTFVDAIPQLEETLNKLCDLLIASRIGLRMDANTVSRAIKHLDRIIASLRDSAHQKPAQA